MSEEILGGCLCGAVRYSFASVPKLQLICHCGSCQKQSGSAFSAAALVSRDEMEINGETKSYTRQGDSGENITRVFCPECGSSLYSEVAARPDAYVVQIGTVDKTDWFKPRVNLWTDDVQGWVAIDPECKNFRGNAG